MAPQKVIRCAVYTRKSTEHNLDLEFNSLDAQRESCEAYIKSQMHEGWRLVPDRYDDGGISGGSLARPDLQRLLADIRASRVDEISNGASIAAIAQREAKSERQIRLLAPLAFVSPATVRALIEGTAKAGTVTDLAKSVPLLWSRPSNPNVRL